MLHVASCAFPYFKLQTCSRAEETKTHFLGVPAAHCNTELPELEGKDKADAKDSHCPPLSV